MTAWVGRRGALSLLAAAVAAGRARADEPARGAVAALAQSLGAAMRRAAGALRAGHRRDATRALDRARRLARFADGLPGLDPAAFAAFAGASGAVEQGRHALQNGRPADAASILGDEAGRLLAVPLATTAQRGVAGGVAPGSTVLDLAGDVVGEVSEVRGQGTVQLSLGGVLGFGAARREVPASLLLAGRDEVMLLASGMNAGTPL